MARQGFVRLFLVFLSYSSLAHGQDADGGPTSIGTVWVTDVVTSSVPNTSAMLSTGSTVLNTERTASVTSFLLAPPHFPFPHSLTSTPSTDPLVVPITIPSATTITDIMTDTTTATLTEPPATVTVPAAPVTVTDVVTISPMPPPTSFQTAWAAPTQMTNLSAFNVTYFPSGQQNLQILAGAPLDLAIVDMVLGEAASGNGPASSSDSQRSEAGPAVMQLLYPQDSIDPGNRATPAGGADFYATPLDLREARSVALEYSVFFPADFDWVQGGKLPGIYGGKVGCSGGDAAVTCFSTRLMWRAGGAGELYLVGPLGVYSRSLS